MTTLLHIKSSSNLQSSNSRKIGGETVAALSAANPKLKVIERDLVAEPVPHLSTNTLGAFFTGEAHALSDALIEELMESHILVIEAPMYNFSLPSVLKAWIDHIARAGKTFRYTATGPEGLLKGKKAYLILSRGGIYSEGPMAAIEHQESYLRALLNFLGITDIEAIRIEGVALGADQAAAALAQASSAAAALSKQAA